MLTDLFEQALSVPAAELELELRGHCALPWADYLLNPRRLRGSDFLMRWSQGKWSEERIVQAVDETGRYFALPYGPSSTAPDEDVQAFELYFERLQQAGLGQLKRPDLLIFPAREKPQVAKAVERVGGIEELPFTRQDRLGTMVRRAVLAIECETSLWVTRQMPDYGRELKPMRRLGGRLGLPKGAVVPTVIVKEEDRGRLREWETQNAVPVHIWHVFYDLAFGISFGTFETLVETGLVEPRHQVFQAPGGATTTKVTYNCYYHHAYRLAEAREEPKLVADYIADRNGHILPYVRFEGGAMELSTEALGVLDEAAKPKREASKA